MIRIDLWLWIEDFEKDSSVNHWGVTELTTCILPRITFLRFSASLPCGVISQSTKEVWWGLDEGQDCIFQTVAPLQSNPPYCEMQLYTMNNWLRQFPKVIEWIQTHRRIRQLKAFIIRETRKSWKIPCSQKRAWIEKIFHSVDIALFGVFYEPSGGISQFAETNFSSYE